MFTKNTIDNAIFNDNSIDNLHQQNVDETLVLADDSYLFKVNPVQDYINNDKDIFNDLTYPVDNTDESLIDPNLQHYKSLSFGIRLD